MSDVDSTPLTRRAILGGVCASALLPGVALTQTTPPTFAEFTARMRALSGFDALPRMLLQETRNLLDQRQARTVIDGQSDATEVEKTVLKALYTGMHRPEEGSPQRFAYADALMYAAIEDTVNVPSYCGGLPAYWAEKPQEPTP